MENVKKILTSNQARTFYWTTFNGSIVLVIAMLTEMNAAFVPMAIAALSFLTKHINKTYLTK